MSKPKREETFAEVVESYKDCTWMGRDGVAEALERLSHAHHVEVAAARREAEFPSSAVYDALGNERHKAVCELRKINTDAGGFVKALANAIGVEWQAPAVQRTLGEIRDRIIYLLGGDDGGLGLQDDMHSVPSPDSDSGFLGQVAEKEMSGKSPVADKLRGVVMEHNLGLSQIARNRLKHTADRIDEDFDKLREERDKWQSLADFNAQMLLRKHSESLDNLNLAATERMASRRATKRDADVIESLSSQLDDMTRERDELQARLEQCMESYQCAKDERDDIASREAAFRAHVMEEFVPKDAFARRMSEKQAQLDKALREKQAVERERDRERKTFLDYQQCVQKTSAVSCPTSVHPTKWREPMARNKEYTCDRCGAEFDTSEGYSLSLTPKSTQRSMFLTEGYRAKYDVCELCARKIQAEVKELICRERRDS